MKLAYANAVLTAVAATVARLLLDRVISYHHPYVTFYLAVLWSAWYGGLGPALVTTIAGAVAAVVFFWPPLHVTLNESGILGLEFYFIVSVSAAVSAQKLHGARQREAANAAIAEERLRELRRQAAERERAEQRLREKQKLESIGVLAGGIAHDFNNLLTGIIGNTTLALYAAPADERIRRYLDAVLADADRSAKLVQQLLAYAGKSEFFATRVRLAEVVQNTAGLVRPGLPEGIELSIETEADVPPVRADANQLQQALTNLLVNAVEAMAENGGVVRVSVRSVWIPGERAPEVRVGELGPGRWVCVEVADSGPGIAPEVAPHIFDPFFTTKFLGRGLGLAAVSGIVRAHHGAVAVSSGGGAKFMLYLPAMETTALTSTAATAPGMGEAGETSE